MMVRHCAKQIGFPIRGLALVAYTDPKRNSYSRLRAHFDGSIPTAQKKSFGLTATSTRISNEKITTIDQFDPSIWKNTERTR